MTRASLRITATVILFATAPQVAAQRYLATRNDRKVEIVDVGAGYLRGPVLFDPSKGVSPPFSAYDDLAQAAVVGDEIWALTSDFFHSEGRVYRFDRSSFAFLGASPPLPDKAMHGLELAGGRAWVVSTQKLFELATDGTLLATHPIKSGAGILRWPGGLLISNAEDDRIDHYDLAGNFLGVFASANHPSFEDPGRMRLRANGNLLVIAKQTLEIDPQGQLVDVHPCSPALDIVETSGGRLCASQGPAWALFCDPFSGEHEVIPGALLLSRLDSQGATRFCPARPNSSGDAASIALLGSGSLTTKYLRLFVSKAPPEQPGFFLFGPTPALTPFGDGALCLGPGAQRLPPVEIGEDGAVLQLLEKNKTALAGLTPGESWYFQFVFRDPAGGPGGWNLSDAVEVVFRP